MDSESSSDEDIPSIARTRKDAKPLTVRRDKNLAEPRTSQGVFGPHGWKLVLLIVRVSWLTWWVV